MPVLTLRTNDANGIPRLAYRVFGFNTTTNIPFPSELTPRSSPARPYVALPYLAFNYLGQLINGHDELVPIATGTISGASGAGTPNIVEMPPGNVTNSFNLISIDWLTGRAHVKRQEVK